MKDKRDAHIAWVQQILFDAGYCKDGIRCTHRCRMVNTTCVRQSFGVTPAEGSQLNTDWEIEADPSIVTVSWPSIDRRQPADAGLITSKPSDPARRHYTCTLQPEGYFSARLHCYGTYTLQRNEAEALFLNLGKALGFAHLPEGDPK